MEVIHKWSVSNMEQLNDGSGTVIRVGYCVNSSYGEVSTQSMGMIELDTENIEDFIPYEELTEELVLGWAKSKLGPNLGNHEINNASWIDSVVNPPKPRTVSNPLPW